MLADPVPTQTVAYFSKTRFLNQGGRSRTADQTPAFLTLNPLRPESGSLELLNLGQCAALFSRHQGKALDEADTLRIANPSTECADCHGYRYSPRSDDINHFALRQVHRSVSHRDQSETLAFCRHLSDSGLPITLANYSDFECVGITKLSRTQTARDAAQRTSKRTFRSPSAAQVFEEEKAQPPP